MDKIRFLILQHEPVEGPGYIIDWIENNGHCFTLVKFYRDDALPPHATYDALVVMGGSMSVNDTKKYAWLNYEKQYIREAVNKGKKVMGICLGAQMVASVLGADVYANPEPEIGFFEISKTGAEHDFTKNMPQKAMVFHWHGETFDLPKGAILLASSEACAHQIFAFGNNVIGIQCHFEITEKIIQQFLCNANLPVNKKYIQQASEIENGMKFVPTCNLILDDILASFLVKNSQYS